MSRQFKVAPGWRLLLRDLGVSTEVVLRRAGLAGDLLAQADAALDVPSYFALWEALAAEVGPSAGLRVAEAMRPEGFSPPLFAALCSRDLNTAAARLSRYKMLVGPLSLDVEVDPVATEMTLGCLNYPALPPTLGMAELVFLVALTRLATRSPVRPIAVEAPHPIDVPEDYEAYFGLSVTEGPSHAIRFAAMDAVRPFLTSDDEMWLFFRPMLDRRLAELQVSATTSERVRAALMELLPSGRSAVDDVASALGVGRRSLQRHLSAENTTFQAELDATREQLARHYLTESALPSGEIAFLLGYDDANSFYRAFQRWTGTTPERLRRSHALG